MGIAVTAAAHTGEETGYWKAEAVGVGGRGWWCVVGRRPGGRGAAAPKEEGRVRTLDDEYKHFR